MALSATYDTIGILATALSPVVPADRAKRISGLAHRWFSNA
jgi:hypothetical protein